MDYKRLWTAMVTKELEAARVCLNHEDTAKVAIAHISKVIGLVRNLDLPNYGFKVKE